MKTKLAILLLFVITGTAFYFSQDENPSISIDEPILSYQIDPTKQDLSFYSLDKNGKPFGTFKNVKADLAAKNREMLFAMNGGMFEKDLRPQGLYIENGKTQVELDTISKGYGNFYLQPNGVFYLTKNRSAFISTTPTFQQSSNIEFATQSGPMLLINGKKHAAFNQGSSNVHIRNGVGLLPNGNLLFAMSKKKINFYDFAHFFLRQGCQDALYLDGFVSRTYLPSAGWEQLEGNFGVIIVHSKKAKE